MAELKSITRNPISITLTQSNPVSDAIYVGKATVGRDVFVVATGFQGNQTAPIESVKIEQYISDHTGWNDIDLNITSQDTSAIIKSNTSGGIKINFPSIAKLRLSGIDFQSNSIIKIDLAW